MEYEFSEYCRSFELGKNEADIEIFRTVGTFGWNLALKINGKPQETPQVFLADKAAYDHAVSVLRARGLNPDMFDDDDHYEIIDSPLNQRLVVDGHMFDIQIYRGADEPLWILEIVNEKGTSIIPDERYETDEIALETALKDFQEEPIEEFLG